MQFGYFNDKRKEYIITNPATPSAWSNYLGNTTYGAIITNNAGGYSFYKSAAQGRFIRFRTNSIPMDQPGRYIYIHDKESKDYWSASWQPVGKPLDTYKSECRHGSSYSIISSDYDNIGTETNYFIPLGEEHEYWWCKITNSGRETRRLRLFTYVEYASNWHLWMDTINLQYTQYILTMKVVDGIIDHGTNVYLPPQPDNFEEGGQARHTFLGLAGAEVTGFDTDRKKFLGTYGDYSSPQAVVDGKCSGSLASGDNGCGVLQLDIDLKPGETSQFVVVMGIGEADTEGKKAVIGASDLVSVENQFDTLRNYWHNRLDGFYAETPHTEFNSMFNMWNPYNCLMTYSWSRAASLVYAGERDGLGFRDTVQDILGVLHIIPEEAGKRLELMLTGQVSTGGAMPVVKPFAHGPGKMNKPDETEYRSDDCLWLFYTVPAYVKETGDINFYNKVLPFADSGKDTVIGHLRKAVEFTLEHSGSHGLPCGLAADWNDCLMLGHEGESVFVAMQLRYALKMYIEICTTLNLPGKADWAEEQLAILDSNIEKYAWDGKWYLRAYRHDGLKYGTQTDEEGSVWLNPQSWAVISGHAVEERRNALLNVVYDRLFTEYGLMICDPPYEKADLNVIKAPLFNKGMKENGSIFCHTQGWAVIAETLDGNGERAFDYYLAYMPGTYNTRAEIREIEPYVYSQSTHSKYSARYGASRLPWLTGAATWSYYAASQYILGVRPEYDGITIDPCIPADWSSFEVRRRFRNKWLNIKVENKNKVEKGVKEIIINGEKIEGSFIPIEKLKEKNEIMVVMG
jgi:N,N'-diacetylchitobiose phosphorylase